MFWSLQNFDALLITAAVIVVVSMVLIVVGSVLKAIAEKKHRPKRKIHTVLIAIGFTLMGGIGLIFLTMLCIQS